MIQSTNLIKEAQDHYLQSQLNCLHWQNVKPVAIQYERLKIKFQCNFKFQIQAIAGWNTWMLETVA